MTESLANAAISTSVRGELKISEAKSPRANRFLSRAFGIEMTKILILSLATQRGI